MGERIIRAVLACALLGLITSSAGCGDDKARLEREEAERRKEDAGLLIVANEDAALAFLRSLVELEEQYRMLYAAEGAPAAATLAALAETGMLDTSVQITDDIALTSGYLIAVHLDNGGETGVWHAYAWPQEHGKTGRRAFLADGNGRLYSHNDALGSKSGREGAPAVNWAFNSEGEVDIGRFTEIK